METNNRFVSYSAAGERHLNICSGLPKTTLQHGTGVCARVCIRVCACVRVFVKPNESNIRLDKKCRALGYICCGNIVAFGKAHIKMLIQIPSLIHRHTHTCHARAQHTHT